MELFPGEELPEVIGVPCCSQFALSAEAVRARGVEDYVRMRKWLIETTLDSATSGRIFEYAWHSEYPCSIPLVICSFNSFSLLFILLIVDANLNSF